jgi:tetratricopeptide (TPR) repeat protein
MEEWKKEREDLDHLVILKPNDSTILLQRAQTCSKLKEMEQVIQDCNKAINMGLERQQLADLYKMRAVAYKKLGKKSEAKQEMAKYESLK